MIRLYIIAGLFFTLMAITSILDLSHDRIDNLSQFHLYIEVVTLTLSTSGAGFFIWQALNLTAKNSRLKIELKDAIARSSSYHEMVKKYAQGLADAIDTEFVKWNLTESEKEIGLLILKGLSTKEISEIQGTSDKTVRHHCSAIYKKSGLSGRSELAAYFLEDILILKNIQ